ncbi:PTS fructose transporter subunit IIB [Maledivibacter halophilus]|uniref:PTS system IIB component, Fru family n=1 Tax=Maledivibacter halophilus TaxID=36842 RepID=A0A1T5IB66_9FIRM|nr:PTS fructose transporter subunit IIB [Maledivibacter halophilus]SKC36397.1 PTS system IIB component, Fru family [Maledivibacter halophilus]
MKIVAVTACTVGLAHTYMAAKALKKYSSKRGFEIKVETQGSMGVKDKISSEEVKGADVVIIAADTKIKDIDRFKGETILQVKVSEAVKKPNDVINRAVQLVEENK